MAGSTSTVQSIVQSNCTALLKSMQGANPGADVGISVGLYYPNDTKVPGFFKYGSAGPDVDFTGDTVFAVGSVTKVFTATLAAYLSVKEVIGNLDQALVSAYLSNTDCDPSGVSGSYWNKATFAEFATQTSGMPKAAPGHYSNQLFADEAPSCAQIEWWNKQEASFEKDRGYWIYSNAGFVTLGFAVAAAAAGGGLSSGYTALLSNVITTPVGMPNTFAADNVPPNAALAQGYNKGKSVPITDAADLKSTANDMVAWLAAIYAAMQFQGKGGSLTALQQSMADTATVWIATPQKPDKEPTSFAMGLGWQIPTFGSAQVLAKDGVTGLGGCSCWVGLTRYASDVPPVGISLMTNQVGAAPDATASTILREIIALG